MVFRVRSPVHEDDNNAASAWLAPIFRQQVDVGFSACRSRLSTRKIRSAIFSPKRSLFGRISNGGRKNNKVRKIQSDNCLLQFALHPLIKQARSRICTGSGNQNQSIDAVFSCGFGKFKICLIINCPLRFFTSCCFQGCSQAGKQSSCTSSRQSSG